jgi:hypothetical protein
MATQQETPQQQTQSTLPLQQGALYGALAFVVGYALSYAYLLVAGSDFLDSDIVSENMLQLVGWVFFNAQFVRIELDQTPATFDLLGQLASTEVLQLPALLLTVLLAVLLIAAGYRVADAVSSPQTTVDQGTVFGATIVTGYLPLVFFGALLFEASSVGGRPDVFGGVLLAGILFPALLGALGGHLAVSRNAQ